MNLAKIIVINSACYNATRMLVGVYNAIFLLSTGVSLQEIALLQAIFTITIVFCEIPLAMFADEFNRKISVTLGVSCNIIFYLFYLKSPNIFYLCLGQFFYGLSASFISGALEGWIVNELDDNKKYPKYNHLAIKIASIGSIVTGSLSFIIYKITNNLYYLYEVSAFLMGIIFISFIFIPNSKKNKSNLDNKKQIEYFIIFTKRLFKSKYIYYYVSLASLYTMLMQIIYFYWQPVISYNENNFEYLLIICYIGVFLSQYFYNHIISKYKNYPYFKFQTLLYIIAIINIVLIIIFKLLEIKYAGIIFYIIMMGALTTMPILLQNKFISQSPQFNDIMSTTLSIFSFISRAFSIFLLVSVYLIPKIDNPVNLFYIPLIILIINLLIHIKWKNINNEESII